MLGESLSSILSSLENGSPVPNFSSGEMPEFNYSSDYSTALKYVRSIIPTQEIPFPIEQVVHKLGVRVHEEEMGEEGVSGYIERRGLNWHIGLNKYEVGGRKRFTLAHELAHLLFHKHILLAQGRFWDTIKLFRSEESSKHIEMEANAFAGDLLMPSEKFRQYWQTSTLMQVSEGFKVSRYAAEYRARRLRLPEKRED